MTNPNNKNAIGHSYEEWKQLNARWLEEEFEKFCLRTYKEEIE